MSSPPSEKEIAVARIIAQSFQCDAGPGASVNHTNNPFMFALIGQFDTLKMAERIVIGIDRHDEAVRAGKERLALEESKKIASAPGAGVAPQ
jgi:hypothetical protein